MTATSGPFAATASGNTATITTSTPYTDALFTSGGFTVGVFGWGNGHNTEDKVTQSNNYATTVDGNSVHLTGLGVCENLCTGFSTALGDTEYLTLDLGSHPNWSLQSITFGDVMATPGEQVEFWFNNDATQSASINDKNDDTILQLGSNLCVGGIGANGSCLFDFSALGVDPDNYQYLWATAVNPNSSNPDLQPAILLTQLTGETDAVPEPSTLSVLGISLLIMGVAWRRQAA